MWIEKINLIAQDNEKFHNPQHIMQITISCVNLQKEKDLELTARIGKELLERNQELKAQVQSLQAENWSVHESNTQLKHELHQKTQILHALTSDEDGKPWNIELEYLLKVLDPESILYLS